MHHTLKFYSRYRGKALRLYIFLAKWTKIPVIGHLVRKIANLFGSNSHGANMLTLNEAYEIIDNAGSIALGPCTCRSVFKNCNALLNAEIMLSIKGTVFLFDERKAKNYRKLSRQEAKDIMKRCHSEKLFHTIIKCSGNYYALCNCCSCCCVPYRLLKDYGIGNALTRKKDIVDSFKKQQPHLS
ncbi:ferredoxin-like protein [Chloroflexota bacterium]